MTIVLFSTDDGAGDQAMLLLHGATCDSHDRSWQIDPFAGHPACPREDVAETPIGMFEASGDVTRHPAGEEYPRRRACPVLAVSTQTALDIKGIDVARRRPDPPPSAPSGRLARQRPMACDSSRRSASGSVCSPETRERSAARR